MGVSHVRRLVVTNAGRYRLVFRVAEVETTSAEFDVTPAAAFAAHTTADVPAGASGQVTEITITVRDQFGNPVVDLIWPCCRWPSAAPTPASL